MVAQVDVGFVGLGNIGAPMAARLGEHFPLTLWARRPKAAAALVSAGAVVLVPHLIDLAACDVVGVCVDDDAAVRSVVLELLPALRPDSVVCVHSTVRPATVSELAEHSATRGVSLVDAPVSGGPDGARDGTLVVLVGGDDAAIGRARPVLDALGTVTVLGPVGAGQLAKLVNNALYTAHLALGWDAVEMAERRGLGRRPLVAALTAGSGGSFALGRRERFEDPTLAAHAAGLLAKDLDLFDEVIGADGADISAVGRRVLLRLRSVGVG